jgi:hypothetical protein
MYGAGATICAVITCVLCGCGHANASRTNPAPALEAAGHEFARTVNVRVADLPGAEAVGREGAGPSPGADALAYARCQGGVSPRRIVEEWRSTLLSAEGGSLLVRSRVTLWPSEALAARNWAAFGRHGARCDVGRGASSVSRLTVALPGGARALRLRATAPDRGGRVGEVDYHDIVAFVSGRAEVALTTAWFSRPVRARTERRLLEALYRRTAGARAEI